jgi:hypothetical protein
MAFVGLSLAARSAGQSPKKTPIATEKNTASETYGIDSLAGRPAAAGFSSRRNGRPKGIESVEVERERQRISLRESDFYSEF